MVLGREERDLDGEQHEMFLDIADTVDPDLFSLERAHADPNVCTSLICRISLSLPFRFITPSP